MKRRAQKYFDTSIELKVEAALDALKVKYIKQYYIKDICNVDFYLPEHKLVIECDGDYWHANPDTHSRGRAGQRRRALDYVRTQMMQNSGFKVLRLWEHHINLLSTTQLKTRIKSVL